MRLTLRTLLAYLDDTLDAQATRDLGLRIAQSEYARGLIERIRKVTRRRGLPTPVSTSEGDVSDPNVVAEYLSDTLAPEMVERVEENALASDAHLAEIAACHQILTLVLTEPVRVPPSAHRRMYRLVRPPKSLHERAPGRTIPITRPLPAQDKAETTEHDATLLLGMTRYKSDNPLPSRVTQGLLVGGLALAVLVSVVMAWPSRPPRSPQISPVSVALAVTNPSPGLSSLPTVPSTSQPQAPPPIKPETPPPAVDVIAEARLAPPPRAVADAEVAMENKDAPPKPPQPPPPADEPRDVRKIVGRLDEPMKAVVLTRSDQNIPIRLLPDDADIVSTSPLVCLPGYKAKIRLLSGVVVDLWANTPEQVPSPVFETRLTFYEPSEGIAADLSLSAGRMFLQGTKAGSRVRVRAGGLVWDAHLTDDRAEVLVEAVPTLEPGTPFFPGVVDTPRSAVAFVITKGTVALSIAGVKDYGVLTSPRYLIWDSGAEAFEEGNDRGKMDYYSRFVLLPPDELQQSQSRAMQKALADFAAGLTVRDGIKTRIAEILSDDGDTSSLNRVMMARYAVYAASGIDEPVYLVDALNSGIKPFLRVAAAMALDRWLPRQGDNSQRLYKQLLAKQFRPESAQAILRLLRRYAPSDLKRPETLDQLLSWMESGDSPALRELAFRTLVTDVDPAALENARLARFDAGGTAAEREPVIMAWRQRLTELKKKLAEAK